MPHLSFTFDPEKFIEAAHYLTSKCPDMTKMKLFKLLYFSDKEHLLTYGRPVIGGHYVAMKDGPVPSQAYDAVKNLAHPFHQSLTVQGYAITNRTPEMSSDSLSGSDLEVLDHVAKELGHMTAAQLRAKSHEDPAWSKCARNAEMDFVGMLADAESDFAALILEDQAVRDLVEDVSLLEESATT